MGVKKKLCRFCNAPLAVQMVGLHFCSAKCHNDYYYEWRRTNPEASKKIQRDYWAKHKDRLNAKRREDYAKAREFLRTQEERKAVPKPKPAPAPPRAPAQVPVRAKPQAIKKPKPKPKPKPENTMRVPLSKRAKGMLRIYPHGEYIFGAWRVDHDTAGNKSEFIEKRGATLPTGNNVNF